MSRFERTPAGRALFERLEKEATPIQLGPKRVARASEVDIVYRSPEKVAQLERLLEEAKGNLINPD